MQLLRQVALFFLVIHAFKGRGQDVLHEFDMDSCTVDDASCQRVLKDGKHFKEELQNHGIKSLPGRGSWPSVSLLEQEVLELETLSELYHKRLSILQDLQKGLQTGLGRHLPLSNVQALQQNVPALAEQVLLGVPPERRTWEEDDDTNDLVAGTTSTATASEDFMVSKAVIPQERPATHLGLMPLRNHRSSAPTPTSQVAMPTVLLVAVQGDGDISLYTLSGDLALTFPSGHKQAIVQLALSPMQDEYVVATVDLGGVMRVHRLTVRPRRSPQEQRRRVTNPDEEKVSSHLGSPANITVQFHLAVRVPLLADQNATATTTLPQLTAFIMTSTQGVKYFVAGDSVGWISVLTRNGTLHGRIRVSNGFPVSGISAHLGNVVYVAGHQWGYVDLEKATARSFVCHKYEASWVHAAVTDTALQSRIIAADEDGTVWVFATRDKRDCKVEHRFPKGTTRAPLSLLSVRGFALALEKTRNFSGRSEMMAFNMSHVGKGWDDVARDFSSVAWRRSSRAVRDWAVQRRYQEGDLLATLSQDGMEIEIYELMMQVYQPPPGDLLGNFKLPVFAAAMILVMGYQFVKQKGPFDPGLAEEAEA
mmetsp:Transcript_22743/g.52603  ORF Transcript_22743/g.52603 Transcript_22743/m.52603 type:complete len:592 (-) Transcript_22743:107-1882(-)